MHVCAPPRAKNARLVVFFFFLEQLIGYLVDWLIEFVGSLVGLCRVRWLNMWDRVALGYYRYLLLILVLLSCYCCGSATVVRVLESTDIYLRPPRRARRTVVWYGIV